MLHKSRENNAIPQRFRSGRQLHLILALHLRAVVIGPENEQNGFLGFHFRKSLHKLQRTLLGAEPPTKQDHARSIGNAVLDPKRESFVFAKHPGEDSLIDLVSEHG